MADAKRTDTPAGQPFTPNAQRETAAHGAYPSEGVGDSPKPKPVKIDPTMNDTILNTSTKAPSGADKDVWAQAEANALNGGGFAGLDKEARTKLVQEQYDQMVENDKQTKKWAGGTGDTVLGDI